MSIHFESTSSILESAPLLAAQADISQRIKLAMAKAKSQRRSLSLLYIDLDRYNTVTSTLGNTVGNALIKTVHNRLASAINTALDGRYMYFHLAADKFIVLFDAIYNVAELRQMGNRLLHAIKKPLFVEDQQLVATASIGISCYPQKACTAQELIEQAMSAAKQAKLTGGDSIKFFGKSSSTSASLRRLNLEVELRNALARNDLSVHYQPKMDLASGKITALEALVRWKHDEMGWIKPAEFIPIAESAGLISQIGEMVLETSCRHGMGWIEAGVKDIKIAVNLSAKQLIRHDMLSLIRRLLKKTGFPPGQLVIELTESLIFDSFSKTPALLKDLRAMGVEIAIDDFGTGYSTFKLLKQIPVDILKIDQMFIQNLTESEADRAITKAIIEVAHTLKMRVIAEGVERREHLELLEELGCDSIQGFYLSEALPRSEVTKILEVGLRDKDSIPRNEELFAD